MTGGNTKNTIALWIIAIALATIVFFMIYSAIAGWALVMWGKPFGFVRNATVESKHEAEPSTTVKAQNLVLLVGSGTVFNFLQEVVPRVFKENDSKITVSVLEGSTDTGIGLLSESFLHGAREPMFSMLAMASEKQEESDFIPVGNDRFFEVQLGEDSLRVAFGALSIDEYKAAFNGGDRKLDESIRVVRGIPAIRLQSLLHWVWRRCDQAWNSQPEYLVYVTSAGSATRALFEEAFEKTAGVQGICWPRDNLAFDLSVIRAVKSDKPWIALGSQLLEEGRISALQRSGKALQLLIVDENDAPITRGLYIYGRLYSASTQHADNAGNLTEAGYNLDKRTAVFLNILFTALESAPAGKRISDETIAKQRAFLHLDKRSPDMAWIAEQAGSNRPIHIYRAD